MCNRARSAHPEHICSEKDAAFLSVQLLIALLGQWRRAGGSQAQDGAQLLTNTLLLRRLHLSGGSSN